MKRMSKAEHEKMMAKGDYKGEEKSGKGTKKMPPWTSKGKKK